MDERYIYFGIFLICAVLLTYDYATYQMKVSTNEQNIRSLATAYTNIINDNSQLQANYDYLEKKVQDLPTDQEIRIVEESKILPPVQLFREPKNVSIYFASNFDEKGQEQIMNWLDDYYFCNHFIASDYDNANIVLSSHKLMDNSTRIGDQNLTVGETDGFATVGLYGKKGKGFISIRENIELNGNEEKSVLIHEFAHYFGLDIHNCSSKLEFSQWCIPILEDYLKVCQI